MRKFHPFFAIGTVEMISVTCLHMFLVLGLSLNSIHTSIFIIYSGFLTFLILWVVSIVKN